MPQLKDYVNAVYNQNQNSSKYNVVGFALTDHGSMSGIVDQYTACNEPDFPERKTKALYGIEIYHCEDVDNNPNNDRFHLVLIAKNDIGLHNIYEIASHAGTHLIYGRQKNFPTTDINFLKTHGTGIIASSACLGGKIPKLITSGQYDEAERYALLFNDIFDEFYLEVQPLEIPEQLMVNDFLVKLSQKTGIPLIITSDSHYIDKSDAAYHNILKDITHQLKFPEPTYLRSPEEMEEYCIKYNIPLNCISNTGILANRCNVNPKPISDKDFFPEFPCPKGYSVETYLRKKAFEGLKIRLIENNISNPTKYIKQMLYELDVICGQGYAGYFLILSDWIKWCRDNGILVGPGRGSAAGSIVTYALRITSMDPIKNGFIFERFLSPERVEVPDCDIDIPRSKRGEAISYFVKTYGVNNVAQIVTFGKYKLKNVTKDVMSYLGCPFKEANSITKDIPDMIDGKEVTWDLIEGIAVDPSNEKYSNFTEQEKKQITNIYDKYQDLFRKYPIIYDAIKSICGCIKSTGCHAGGVIICKEDLRKHSQIYEPNGSSVLPVIQFDMHSIDFMKMLKIDALGLSTLDVIKETMDLAGLDYDWYDSEEYDDPKVYEMLRSGETTDIFQMAGYMATKMINDFKVNNIEGLTAVNAGNRPGPLEKSPDTGKSMVDLYTERRETNIVPSIDPRIDDILKDTYGCIYFQEQCIFLGQRMAGYTLGKADSRVRKPLCKKKVKMIPEIRNEFIYGKKSLYDEDHNVIGISEEDSPNCIGAVRNGFSLEVANQIFDTIEAFAKYSSTKYYCSLLKATVANFSLYIIMQLYI
jgi:DNA polymerase-3 subunit alpha